MHNSDTLFYETRNIGLLDRGIRITAGTVAILAVLFSENTGMLGWLAIIPLLSVYPIMTGLLAYDPFYAWIGIKTSRSSMFSDEHLQRFVTDITDEETLPTRNSSNKKTQTVNQPRTAA